MLFLWLLALSAEAAQFDVRSFGATGDGVTKDTAAMQRAIDAAGKQGGTVLLPPGRYLSGTIRLKSNVTLHLDNGAVLLGSPDNQDYDTYEELPFQSVSDRETTYFRYGLITAEGVHHIAIEGKGVIDGNRTKRGGPKPIAIKLSQHITIRGVTVRNAPNYAISLWGSDFIDIDGVTVLNGYADGIDPDSCRYVRIANSYIDAHDDAICPKASPSMGMDKVRPVEHLTVTNCTLRTDRSAFKFGTESSGDLRHVAVTNCTIARREGGRRTSMGLALEAVDGANIDGVVISNIEMTGVDTPIFIRLGNRGRGLNPRVPGSIHNVLLQNIVARDSITASSVTGLPGHPVRRVQMQGLLLGMTGGLREARSLDVPEKEEAYPEGNMWGPLPGFGFYARHVEELTLSNLHTYWEKEDVRPAAVFDDVKELALDGFRAGTSGTPAIWLNNVAGALIRGARTTASTLLKVSGSESRAITLHGNDLTRTSIPVQLDGAPKNAVVTAPALR